jgi:Dyp-type peroxidase family
VRVALEESAAHIADLTRVPSALEEPVLAVDDIQGNILPGFNTEHLALLGLRIRVGEEAAARLWLGDLRPIVTSFSDAWAAREVRRAVALATGVPPPRPGVFLNVALSFDALAPLGLPTAAIPAGLFRKGMTVATLEDALDARGVPIGWKVGATPETTPHVLLVVGADDRAALTEATRVLTEHTGSGSGFDKMYEDEGHRLAGEIEHFGFRDGVSQPGVRGRRTEHPDSFVTRRYISPDDPLAERFARPGQPLVWPGQFIFGYATQDEFEGPGPIAQPPEPWMRNGSFLVFRRLRQDVEAFEQFAVEQAERLTADLGRPVSAAEVKGWMVGRWPNGAALVRWPDGPPPPESENEFELNHFDYADRVPDTQVVVAGGQLPVRGSPGDPGGLRCPYFAHVRKVNLRDKLTDRGPSFTFRILRRGIPYGHTGDVDRGLLFLCYQRDLEPFMTLSANWMNSAAAPEGLGHDLLVGQNLSERRATRRFADGRTAPLSAGMARWVVPTGGAFFFAPAKSVLAGLGA